MYFIVYNCLYLKMRYWVTISVYISKDFLLCLWYMCRCTCMCVSQGLTLGVSLLIFCSTQLHLAFQGPALTSSYGCCRVYLLAICPVPTFAWSSILKASSFRTERKQENPCINHLASKTCYFVHGSKTLLV